MTENGMFDRLERHFWLPGAGCLLASAGIHLDLYLTGYRAIPTIGPLFLLQSAAGLLLAVAVLYLRARSVAGLAALFSLSTIGGYGLSRVVGLFGFHELATSAGLTAGLVEAAGFAFLAAFATWPLRPAVPTAGLSNTGPPRPGWLRRLETLSVRLAGVRALGAVVVLGLAAVGVTVAAGVRFSPAQGPPVTSAAPAVPAGSVHVEIADFAFVPSHLIVAPGEEVVVRNADQVTHTLTATPGSHPFGGFDSGDIGPGVTKVVRAPMRPGAYQFYCTMHHFMTGVLTVS